MKSDEIKSPFCEKYERPELIKGSCFFCIYLAIQFLPVPIYNLAKSEFFFNNVNFILYLFLFLITLLLFVNTLRVSIKNIKIEHFKSFVKIAIITFVILIIIGILMNQLDITNYNQESVNEAFSQSFALMTLTALFLGPIVEEFLFRFFIFRLIRKFNFILAHFTTAFLFGFSHAWYYVVIKNNMMAMFAMLPSFSIGLSLSIIYEKTKTLAFPILFHILWNLIIQLV